MEAGYNAQLGRHLTTNLLSLNQIDPEIFYGFVRQYGSAGAINLMNSRMDSTVARQAGIPYPYPSFPGSQSVRQALRPFPQYLDINTGADGGDRSGRSNYHAFILRGEKRYAAGLTFLASYVFSKTETLRSDRANAGDGRAMNHFNREADMSLSAFDQPHNIKLNYSYELPFGPGKPFLKQGVMSVIAGGWRIAGVHAYASGFPLSVALDTGCRSSAATIASRCSTTRAGVLRRAAITSIRSSICGGTPRSSTGRRSRRSPSCRDSKRVC